VLVALFVGASALALVGEEEGRAPGDVTLAGVPVGGLTEGEIAAIARRRADEVLEDPLVIQVIEETGFRFSTSRVGLGARPQLRRAVADATRPRSPFARLAGRLGVGGARDVPLRFTLDEEQVDALLERVVGEVNQPAASARLEVTESDIVLLPARQGFGVDPADLRRRILDFPGQIDVVRTALAPPVDDAAARRARGRALRALAQPAEVTFKGRSVEIGTDVLRSALSFEERPPRMAVRLDPEIIGAALSPAFSSRTGPARDAAFRVQGDRVRLVPAATGRALNIERIARQIVARPGAPVTVRFEISEPEVTTAELRELHIEELVSSFTTPYACCQPRVTNIQLAAELLDGMIIPPGGRFSLNEALGERTAERGFVSAPQIAAGKLEEAIGGGVSQIATTIFNAAFFAGVQLVTHTPHSFYISRYPAGREATVSHGGPELIFVNDWPAGILIDAEAGSEHITFRFFSADLGRRVETESGEPHDYVQPRTFRKVNPDLEPGTEVVEQPAGGAGFTISYTRRVYRGDDLKRDESYTWRYRPQDAYIEVGPPEPDKPDKPERPGEKPDKEPVEEPPSDPGGTPETPPPTNTRTGEETIPAPSPLPPPLPGAA